MSKAKPVAPTEYQSAAKPVAPTEYQSAAKPVAPTEYQSAAAVPMTTAGSQQSLAVAPATPAVHTTVASIVTAVQNTTPPVSWATTAAAVLSALQPEINALMALTRSSATTQGYVAVGEMSVVGLAQALQLIFPHPAA